jgi:peroxiredoxin
MGQQEELKVVGTRLTTIADPETIEKIYGAFENSQQTTETPKKVQVGDQFPDFHMPCATGKDVSLSDLLQQGPILITFYRGEWCPYCNIAVQYLQRHLEDFRSRDVTLVAISPELPDYSLSMAEKNDLKFPVLSDLHNTLTKKLGILYDQSGARGLHDKLGIDLIARNGEDTWEVPIPATILVDKSGIVRATYIETDFRKRLEPEVALRWIDSLLN